MAERRFGKKDALFLGAVALALAGILVLSSFFGQKEGASVKVTVDGDVYGIYPLDEDQSVEILIDGRTANLLLIQNGEADMVEADCPDKLCVRQRAISKAGETIVCLPHRVVAEVTGGEESDLDSVTGMQQGR